MRKIKVKVSKEFMLKQIEEIEFTLKQLKQEIKGYMEDC